MQFSKAGNRLFGACADRTVHAWNTQNGELLTTLRGHPGNVRSFNLNHDDSLIVTTSADSVRMWRTDDKPGMITFPANGLGAALGAGNRMADYGANVFGLTIRDAITGKVLQRRVDAGTVLSAAFDPRGELVATGSADGRARVFNVLTGDPVATFDQHQGPVTLVAFNREGAWVASTSDDRSVRVWNARSGKQKSAQQQLPKKVLKLKFLAGSGEIALHIGGKIVLYQPDAPRARTCEFYRPSEPTISISAPMERVSPSRRRARRSFRSGTRARANQFERWPRRKAPDGLPTALMERVASVSKAGQPVAEITVWDANRGESLVNVRNPGRVGLFTSLAFGPAGRFLIAKSPGKIHLWDAKPKPAEFVLSGHSGLVTGIEFVQQPRLPGVLGV